jgi:hypothetical protein
MVLLAIALALATVVLGLIAPTGPSGASDPAWRASGYLSTAVLSPRQVACPDDHLCVAVGGTTGIAGAYSLSRDGGATWTLASAQYASSVLSGVSCPTSAWCVASGVSNHGGPLLLLLLPAGPYWGPLVTPRGAVTTERVACATVGTCVVAGTDRRGPVLWSTTTQGASWTRTRLATMRRVASVWCGAQLCLAGGPGVDHHPVLLRSVDAGATWGAVSVPQASGAVTSVACASELRCMAVVRGGIADSTDGGQTWTAGRALPGEAGRPVAASCPTVDRCVVAGRDAVVSAGEVGGSWSVLSSTASIGVPRSISCSSPGSCTVAGEAMLRGGAQPPAVWTTSGPARPLGRLASVSCPTSLMCVASGGDRRRGAIVRSIDLGRTWSKVDAPAGSDDVPVVSCGSSSSCLAVTDGTAGLGVRRSIDGGSTWTAGSAPGALERVESLSCSSSSDCWAAGGIAGHAIVERTDDGGATWRATALGGPDGMVAAISCVAPSTCVATGASLDDSGLVWRTVDGDHWARVATPDVGGLDAVSCTSTGRCAAVGQAAMGSDDGGATWTAQGLASPADRLGAVACEPTGGCVATGWSIPADAVVPLTMAQKDAGTAWTAVADPQGTGYFSALSWPEGSSCVVLTALTGGIGVIRYG